MSEQAIINNNIEIKSAPQIKPISILEHTCTNHESKLIESINADGWFRELEARWYWLKDSGDVINEYIKFPPPCRKGIKITHLSIIAVKGHPDKYFLTIPSCS